MPLVAPAMQAKFKKRIFDGLKAKMSSATSKGDSYSAVSEEFLEKIADAVSGIAIDLVEELTTNAQVLPGQQIVGVGGGVPGPVQGATVSPGKIL